MKRVIKSSEEVWPDQDFWDSVADDDEAFEDAIYEYLNDPESEVLDELGYSSESSGYGDAATLIITNDKGETAEIDFMYLNEDEWDMAYNSTTREEYKDKFREYVQNLEFKSYEE